MDDAGAARILVVDDDAFLRQLVTGLLRRDGHTVTTAASAEEALDQLSTADGEPDLLVLDVELPAMSGLELLAKVHGWLTCPVILMSGTDTEPAKSAALAAGAVDYIIKPFQPKELVARVQAAVRSATP